MPTVARISDSFVRASDGSIVPNGTPCFVYERGTQTLATLYDETGDTTIANPTPITAGVVDAFAESPGSYDLAVTVGAGTTVSPFEAILASQIEHAGLSVTTKTANYTVSDLDDVVLADATAEALTLKLPSAVGFAGQLVIKAVTGTTHLVTVETVGEQTFNGAGTTVTLGTPESGAPYSSITLVSDGVRWQII